jgi:hypothetical protein
MPAEEKSFSTRALRLLPLLLLLAAFFVPAAAASIPCLSRTRVWVAPDFRPTFTQTDRDFDQQPQWFGDSSNCELTLEPTIDPDGRLAKGFYNGLTSGSSPAGSSGAFDLAYGLGGILGGYYEGLGQGAWNEAVGVGRLAKGATFDLGQQITLTGFDIYGTHFSGEDYQFESAAFRGTYNMGISGASGSQIAGEAALQLSGYRFGNQIFQSLEQGAATGDYSHFSQNMGTFAGIALSGTLGAEAPPKTGAEATGFLGSKGFELGNAVRAGEQVVIQDVRNAPAVIGSRNFSGHALDQMQNRGIMPSVVENTLNVGQSFPTRAGTAGFYDSVNNVRVIVNSQNGTVVTVIRGAP